MFIDLITHGYLLNQIMFIKFNYIQFNYLMNSIKLFKISTFIYHI